MSFYFLVFSSQNAPFDISPYRFHRFFCLGFGIPSQKFSNAYVRVFDVRNNCRRYGEARGKRKFDFSRSEMNENWNHGLSTICVRHDSMKSKAKMPLLFSYLSLRGLWLGRKCRFKMKIAMIFTLPPACVHILFICMWEAGMEVSFRSALSTLGDGVWTHEKNNRKVKWRKVVNSLAIEIRTKDAQMYTQSEAKKCRISEFLSL